MSGLRTKRFTGAASCLAVVGMLALSACQTGGTTPEPAPAPVTNAPATIKVGGYPSTEEPKLRAAFDRTVTEFVAANPHIKVEPDETQWSADTFQAQLAGGTLPTTFGVPFTEIGSLIQREQVAPVGDYLKQTAVLNQLNPAVAKVVTDQEGKIWGIPTNAYTMGLIYNRALFTKAGLDPNSPPKTWDEVRAAAKEIDAKTDAQGFNAMTKGNTGGWILTTMSYSFGGTTQNPEGTTATITNPGTTAALEFYRALRWEDNTMGSNFLVGFDDAVNAFAAGKVGMYVAGADQYSNLVVNRKMKPEDFGLAPLPQAANGIGTLGGGHVMVMNPKATPEQIMAATKWVEFSSFRKYVDQAKAVADAKSAVAEGIAVGAPGIPVVSTQLNDQYLGWVKDQVNVPRENFQAYLSTVEQVPLVLEPRSKAQESYATLDTTVQAVLTREDADIAALLETAQKTMQSAIEAG